MKNLILSLLLVLTVSLTHAQKINFCDTSNKWYTHHLFVGGSGNTKNVITEYIYSGFAQIGQYIYSEFVGGGYVRFDSLENKVFYKRLQNDTDVVLYDYNLKVGDTVTRPSAPYLGYNHPVRHVVIKIDTVIIFNEAHKRFYFTGADPALMQWYFSFGDYLIIEGIGCTSSPFVPLTGITSIVGSAKKNLICFRNKQGVSPLYSSCTPYMLSTQNSNLAINELKIFPQPATKEVTIQLPENITSGTLYILNTMGQLVAQQSINNSNTIKYNNNSLKGIYYYRIANNNESQQYTGKLLFE